MKNTNRLIFWLIVVFIVAGTILLIIGGGGKTQQFKVDAIGEAEQTKGNPEAKITIIEYSDFQCPACATYYPVLKALASEFENYVYFGYRHFPLRAIHDKADLTSQAAEAAGLQGKFWEMHDMIFDNQTSWASKTPAEALVELTGYAEKLGLDMEKFTTDINSKAVKDVVDASYANAQQLGLPGTPSIFLNGEMIQKPANYESFRQLIRQKIEETQS